MDGQNGRLLSPLEVAKYLGLSRSFVYQLAETGDLPCVKIGRSIRFRPRAIEQFIEDREQAQEART